MVEKYQHFDRTRLFRDPDWQCCQRWIGVEVPWKPQWNEKFHFKLTKESPLVLVLQQLDARYFKGLRGQYTFRMHFRVHQQGRPGSEDYIVRSHGNYLMSRSVSIEIPCMEPGDYSVFLSVVAERDTDMPSIEDIVKRECRKREENEKFAQVGYAYDLAHSKGVAHLEHVAALRKRSDQKKASASRQQERRKMWEKRHLNREITKKQTKKNQEKREKRREAEATKRKAKEEAEAAEKKKVEEQLEAERKKEEEEKPKDAAVQTDAPARGEDKSSQTGSTESDAPERPEDSEGQKDAPEGESANDKKEDSEEGDKKDKKQEEAKTPPAPSDPTEPTPAVEEKKTRASAPAYSSDCDSSDSPVEDWELLYSSDDMSKKPRMATPQPAAATTTETVESDGESALPDPWNAICIVGFRVYSKDKDLDLRVVIEGGDLAEGGMGEKGAADIDDAQMNAGGGREQKKEADKTTHEFEIVDGAAVVKQKLVVDENKADNAEDKKDREKKEGDKTVDEERDQKKEDEKKDETKDETKDDKKEKKKDDNKGKDAVDDGNDADTEDDGEDDDNEDLVDAAKSDVTDSTDSTPINTPDSTTEGCSPQWQQ